ncbi:hypothetical protein RJT34_04813 [Clitoria ternatea]|uniref:Uncharacterized protein n=1 Tax=Clitoria ternatea TaxID=43366 RepID=A0AAN9KMB5_CLITE
MHGGLEGKLLLHFRFNLRFGFGAERVTRLSETNGGRLSEALTRLSEFPYTHPGELLNALERGRQYASGPSFRLSELSSPKRNHSRVTSTNTRLSERPKQAKLLKQRRCRTKFLFVCLSKIDTELFCLVFARARPCPPERDSSNKHPS